MRNNAEVGLSGSAQSFILSELGEMLRDAILEGRWDDLARLLAGTPTLARDKDGAGNMPLHLALVCRAPHEAVRFQARVTKHTQSLP